MKLNIKNINIIQDDIEKYILIKITKTFGQILDNELINIQSKVYNKFNKKIDIKIIASIKSSYMKDYIIKHHYRINKYSDHILENYKSKGILNISNLLNISPMALVRFIFKTLYNKNLQELINNNILSEYDKQQYKIALENDIYGNLDNSETQLKSLEFEKQIENFLLKNNIKYSTQEELSKEQIIEHGKSINTPDFLIKSKLVINNIKINWIDAKNFYGANNNFIINKIKKQSNKYILSHGTGLIIFNYGFNSKLNFNNILLLDFNSLLY